MKKILLTLTFCMTFGTMLLAQSEYQETRVYSKFLSKTINEDNSHSWNLNFLSLEKVGQNKNKHSWKSYSSFGPDMISIGFAGMTESEGFDYKPGGSWEWGFSLMSFELWSPNDHFGICTELDLTRSSYRVKGNDAFHVVNVNGEKITVCDDALKSSIDYSRQRLINWSWRVPVTLCLRASNGVHVSAGAEAELRHHVRSRAKVGEEKKYYIERNNLAVNDFGYNAIVTIGTNDFEIYGRYNLTDYFGKNAKVSCQPISIGVMFFL